MYELSKARQKSRIRVCGGSQGPNTCYERLAGCAEGFSRSAIRQRETSGNVAKGNGLAMHVTTMPGGFSSGRRGIRSPTDRAS